MAVLCGRQGWEDIEIWAYSHEAWLRSFLDLPETLATADTYAHLFARLDPAALTRSLIAWTNALVEQSDGRLIAVDGKTLRGAFARASERTPLHLVSAFAARNQVVLAQVKTQEGSNEIAAIRKLLELLHLKGAVVTIDAAGTQTQNAAIILEKGGDYVLPLKENQPNTLSEVREFFAQCEASDWDGLDVDTLEVEETRYGRTEIRRITVLCQVGELACGQKFAGTDTIARVDRERKQGEKREQTTHYFLSSLSNVTAPLFASYVRGHWSIENQLHYRLDVTFKEDLSRAHRGNAAENLAALRRVALPLLQKRQGLKKRLNSVRNKMLTCDGNNAFLLDTLLGGFE